MFKRFMLFEIISVAILIALIIGCCSPMQSAAGESPVGTAAETTISSTTIIVRANSTASGSVSTQESNGSVVTTALPLSHEGWLTFTSPALGMTLEYPPDWSISEGVDEITLTSPQGSVIVFSLTEPNGNSNEIIVGNQHCTPRTNAHNLTADVCVETVSFSYSARFTLTYADGSIKWLMMKTITRGITGIFDAMFNSVHQ